MSAGANLQAVLRFDPWLLLLSAVGVVLALVGTLAAASLLLYSPSRMRSKDGRGLALADELTARAPEYQVVARTYAIGGLVLAFLTLHAGIDAQSLPVALGVLGAVVLFLCGVLPASLAERRPEAVLERAVPALRPGWWLASSSDSGDTLRNSLPSSLRSRKRWQALRRHRTSSSLRRPAWRAVLNSVRGEWRGLLDGPRVRAS